jgi:hypothetical protein
VLLHTAGDNGACVAVAGACSCMRDGVRSCTGPGFHGSPGKVDGSYAPHQFTSFKNPSGAVVIVALNAHGTASAAEFYVDGVLVADVELPPHSFSTFLVEA